MWQRFEDEGVIVLGVSGSGLFGNESTATLNAFVEQTGVSFPILRGDSSYFQYGEQDGSISPFPLDVIVDAEGRIRYLRHEFDGDAMAAEIERLLAQ